MPLRPGAACLKATCARTCRAIEARLANAGFEHYETSAFAQPGFCQHNLNYWSFGDYLGIGAGAHGKLTMHDRVLRQMRFRQPAQCLKQVASGQPVHEETNVDATDLPFEFMMNALRLIDGFDPGLFEARTTVPLSASSESCGTPKRMASSKERRSALRRPCAASDF